ncbi:MULTISPECIES: MlaD family protein [unclassified Pseudonocardia]|uniref:MlaD family protein n=1 Tax=unclassified Pseudonocardia TaxID=2619320 RepID=UPI0001FFE4B5|nr:MlaD family protein [Pseudonocardia sp. Ae707_Ps1]OLM16737.1 hypothetical protein Ae707Ps1_0995 [Pseudonocardia sp. Ae707_Ps1]
MSNDNSGEGRLTPGVLAALVGFLVLCLGTAVVFYINMGGRIPLVNPAPDYRISFTTSDVDNLVEAGDVRIAGVDVGEVSSRKIAGDTVRVEMTIADEFAPLHEGMTTRIGLKSLLGASYVDVVDGTGTELESGAELPPDGVRPSVEVDDVIAGLDPATRDSLSSTVQSLGAGTAGRQQDVDGIMTGLGDLGRNGHTALDALAAQSADITALTREAGALVDTLDTGQGQIATLARDAQRIVGATAGQRENLEGTVRRLPGALGTVRDATDDLSRLSGSLAPVAADLRTAAPDLNAALVQLPATTADLRGLLGPLDGVLDRAPATLDRIPALGENVSTLVPEARPLLQDLNPMVSYLAPYGRDTGSMIANFAASFQYRSENGLHVARLAPILNSSAVRGQPLNTEGLDPTIWTNPYPLPGEADRPTPFGGQYPRVERAPD